jgi:2-iminobutanoate/2-iminopropanoate deaminase
MLVLPGGVAWDKKNKEAALAAAAFLEEETPVAAICGATAGLARIGLLDSVAHTSNSRDYLAQSGYKGGRNFRDEPAVRSGNLITASAMSPLEFAREVFSTLGIYSEKTLSAWYSLYKTGDAKIFRRSHESKRWLTESSMSREIIRTKDAPASPPTYSQAVKAAGLVFVSGTGPHDPKSGALVEGTIQQQTRQCLANISAILAAAGTSLEKVVSATVILAEESDFAGMNEEWVKWFPVDPPARQGAKLPVRIPGFKVSIAAIATSG